MRTVPIHRSISRSNLFLGGDRELVMMSGLIAFALIFTAQKWVATIFGIVLWFGALFVLRLMAKADPQMRHVFLRYRKYPEYAPARSTPFCVNKREYK